MIFFSGGSSAIAELSENVGLFENIYFPSDQADDQNNLLKAALSALQINEEAAKNKPNEIFERSHMSEGTRAVYECACDCEPDQCECEDHSCTVRITRHPQV